MGECVCLDLIHASVWLVLPRTAVDLLAGTLCVYVCPRAFGVLTNELAKVTTWAVYPQPAQPWSHAAVAAGEFAGINDYAVCVCVCFVCA